MVVTTKLLNSGFLTDAEKETLENQILVALSRTMTKGAPVEILTTRNKTGEITFRISLAGVVFDDTHRQAITNEVETLVRDTCDQFLKTQKK